MEEDLTKANVNEMFQKMGEKLGWFKHKDLDTAAQVLSKSAKKKSTKSRVVNKTGDNVKNTLQSKKKTTGKDKIKVKKKLVNSVEKPGDDGVAKRVPVHTTLSFDGLLSSDSDTSPCKNSDRGRKKINSYSKATLQVSSDTDDEKPVVLEDTYVGCIPESPDEDGVNSDDSRNEKLRAQGRRNIMDSDASGALDDRYNETVLKNRVSLASLSLLDLESFGEPLVESTRIHRRSSVTYKQFITSPDESSNSSGGQAFKGIGKNINRDCDGDDVNDPCNTTNVLYITAVEKLDDLNATVEKLTNDVENLEVKDTGNYSNFSESEPESDEIVEVVDTATQTDVQELDSSQIEPVTAEVRPNLRVYREATIIMTEMLNDTTETINKPELSAYDHSTVNRIDLTDEISNSASDVSEIHNEGAQKLDQSSLSIEEVTTPDHESVRKVDMKEKESSAEISASESLCMYDQPTTAINSLSMFSDVTIDKHEGTQVYDQGTLVINKQLKSNLAEKSSDLNSFENNQVENLEVPERILSESISKSSSSDESVYEVKDIATQTEDTLQSACDYNNISKAGKESEKEQFDKLVAETKLEMERLSQSLQVTFHEANKSDNDNSDEYLDTQEDDYSDVKEDTFHETVEHETECENVNSSSVKEHINEDVNVISSEEEGKSQLKTESEDESNSSVQGQINGDETSEDSLSTGEKKNQKFVPSSSCSSDDESPIKFSLKTRNIKKSLTRPDCVEGSKSTTQTERIDKAEQSWRSSSSRIICSDSSSGDDLENFFQKMRQPKKKKQISESEGSSSMSLDDFIVEDEDMTSDSDDSAFYIRETQKMEEVPLTERLRKNRGQSIPPAMGGSDDDDVFSSKVYPASVTKHKKNCNQKSWSFSSSSDSDEGSDRNQKKIRGKGQQKGTNRKPGKPNTKKNVSFDSCSDSEDENDSPVFKTPNPIRKIKHKASEDKENKFITPKSKILSSFISISDSEEERKNDDDDDDDDTDDSLPSLSLPSSNKKNISSSKTKSNTNSDFKLPKPVFGMRQPDMVMPLSTRGSSTYSFLKSLSNTVDDSRRHPEAVRLMKSFKKNREELSNYLFVLFNKTIFNGKLPSDMPVLWNKRLLRTAGYCAYKKSKEVRTARVELSTKVCDTPERARDTLIHELCHAAVWLLNEVNGGHGPFWKYWARHSNRIHPELPVIQRCHSYSISTKFTYKCTQCGYSIGRHSKSLDTSKKVCGYCRGTFQLIQNAVPRTPGSATSSATATPKMPNKFAMFVKEHYSLVKKKNTELKHGGVMKELSKLFAESKISS